MINGKRILLIIGGGIAAYKSLDLIRRFRERGIEVRVVMTEAAAAFVTPLSVGAISGEAPFTNLFDQTKEHDVGHIRLAREADLIVIAPATADLLARMAAGLASDLAAAVLLAAKAPVLAAPAMNPAMWAHPATQRNVTTLRDDGIRFVGPAVGEMAEAGESGLGRMSEPVEILLAVETIFKSPGDGPLAGQRALVTAGPTHEPLDPIRHISNRSSGRQGYAIATAAADAGAEVTLISGPVQLADPAGVTVIRVETAAEMQAAVEAALPVDIAIMAAAVSDWRPIAVHEGKMKKTGDAEFHLDFVANPDILAELSHHPTRRPRLVVGFAAETDNIAENARAKLSAKGCDLIVANDVSRSAGTMGGVDNAVKLITAGGVEAWPAMPKTEVARRLIERIAALPELKKAAE